MSFPDPKPNQFHKTTLDEAIAFYWYGMINVSGLLYFAVTIYRKQGQTFRIDNIPAFCEKLGITQRAFYKAKAALVSTGFLEEEIYGAVGLKSVRLYDEQSFSESEQSFSESEQSFSESEQSFSESEQSFTTTHSEQPQDKVSSDPSDIIQIDQIDQTLSDRSAGLNQCSTPAVAEEVDEQLTVESTPEIGSSEKEREREIFLLKEKLALLESSTPNSANESVSCDEEVSQGKVHRASIENSEVTETKHQRSSPKTENESRSTESRSENQKPSPKTAGQKDKSHLSLKNSSSKKNKGFGTRSTKKVLNTTKSTNELRQKYGNRGFPRLIEKLYEEGLEESKHNEFIDLVIKRFKAMPKYPGMPDVVAINSFDSFMGDYLEEVEKKDAIAAAIEASKQQQAKPVEALDPEKEKAAKERYLKQMEEIKNLRMFGKKNND